MSYSSSSPRPVSERAQLIVDQLDVPNRSEPTPEHVVLQLQVSKPIGPGAGLVVVQLNVSDGTAAGLRACRNGAERLQAAPGGSRACHSGFPQVRSTSGGFRACHTEVRCVPFWPPHGRSASGNRTTIPSYTASAPASAPCNWPRRRPAPVAAQTTLTRAEAAGRRDSGNGAARRHAG